MTNLVKKRLRKALIAVGAVVTVGMLYSCEESQASEKWKQCEQHEQQVRQEALKEGEARYAAQRAARFHKNKFAGHFYIVYEAWGYSGCGASITHDPDCPCGKGGAL